jgi:hypothetical protein
MSVYTCAPCGSHSEPLRDVAAGFTERVCLDREACEARESERLLLRHLIDNARASDVLYAKEKE